jgi:hypothetical protein
MLCSMNRRSFVLAFVLALPPALALSPDALTAITDCRRPVLDVQRAEASVSVMISLDEIVAASSYVVVATAGERRSVWEEMPSGRRIVTYTRLTVENAVTSAPGKELWVRTLGGAVGKIGQSVAGEAQIATGSRSLLFLADVGGILVVAARAQGHFPIVTRPNEAPKLASSPDAGTLLPRRGPVISARERLLGAALDDALTAVKQAHKARQANGQK